MNILLLGSGGREHAFAWKISQSPLCDSLFIAPGNSGTANLGQNISISVTNFKAIKEVVLQNNIEMVIVGPEDPLVQGIHDFFLNDASLKNKIIIGPQKQAAQLEGSKKFAKQFMQKHQIPTAAYKSFTKENIEEGYRFLEALPPPYVLKADGLAAGKGVLILSNLNAAKAELKNMLVNQKFGTASQTVVIEEFLEGIELSCFVLTDGKNYKILPTAKDYKRIGENDTGLNTGGMGAVAPVPFVTPEFLQLIENTVVKPTINGLQTENIPYKGFIFIGLIKVGNKAKVIEYNVRMGDPETEVVLPLLKTDLVEMFQAVATTKLNTIELEMHPKSAATVMLVSGGYPKSYKKGVEIIGIETVKNSIVFHAGSKKENHKLITSGGRVLAVTSYGNNFKEALQKSYTSIEQIHFKDMYYRKDIGFDL